MSWHVAHASRPHPSETANGDVVVVIESGPGILCGIIDGLGHGPHAFTAASIAAESLRAMSPILGVEEICRGVHQALRGTRGAAATILKLQHNLVSGCGVGNVEVRAAGGSLSAVINPGILGLRALRFRVFEAAVPLGIRLHVFSDGISSRFDAAAFSKLPPDETCAQILSRWSKPTDDATILIAERG